MSVTNQYFVDYIIKKVKFSKGNAAMLRRANSPNTEHYAWDILFSSGAADLDVASRLLSYGLIAADIANKDKPVNGSLGIGEALRLCYSEAQIDQAKAKLRRLLACDDVAELCGVLRPLFGLIDSRVKLSLDYVSLLYQVLNFNIESFRYQTKRTWAIDFYTKDAKEDENEQ